MRRDSDCEESEREHADRAGHRYQFADLSRYGQNENPTTQLAAIQKAEISFFYHTLILICVPFFGGEALATELAILIDRVIAG